ncbi:hypothetical protein BDR03DRAFT_566744 [Suillus americanus]|nr:hypothetical protein BDR03DRAFT_566744 [Suillus americanus]
MAVNDRLRRSRSSAGIRRWRIIVIVAVVGSGGHMLGFVAENSLHNFVSDENQSDRRQADRVYREASRSLLFFGQDLSDIVDNNPFEARDGKEASDSGVGSHSSHAYGGRDHGD